ncbi:tol-pal system YbgF family protein [Maribacter sp. R77961]|uniref:tol-pal system YbgF family protein n=1 Tax=Maribacter sp. R77961 TaxID=3093871 RepID=UPI0037C842D9
METENNISQDLLETIERYLKNSMELEELAAFEKRMEEDEQLRQQVDDTRFIFSGIRRAVLKDKLNVLHEDFDKGKQISSDDPKVFKLNFKTLSIAASVLILFGGFWFFNQQPSNEKLFNQYFEPDRGLATVMSNTNNYDFDDAMVDYKNQKYNLAIQKWEALLKDKPKNDTLNYFLGVAQLAENKETSAIAYLTKVVSNKQSAFVKDAYFYLGLAYLKEENSEAALINLKINNSPKSKEIISELTN